VVAVKLAEERLAGVPEHAGVEPDDGFLLEWAEAPGLGSRRADAFSTCCPGDGGANELQSVGCR
jgi:hypothetical protein